MNYASEKCVVSITEQLIIVRMSCLQYPGRLQLYTLCLKKKHPRRFHRAACNADAV